MEKYVHKVQYYETDKMGITHHSNYIRWMEEARVKFLDNIGYGYAKLEADGISSPVIGIECSYKSATTFDDEVEITTLIEEYTGVKLAINYTMRNIKNGKEVLQGKSRHCFTDENGRPINLKKKFPELDSKLRELLG